MGSARYDGRSETKYGLFTSCGGSKGKSRATISSIGCNRPIINNLVIGTRCNSNRVACFKWYPIEGGSSTSNGATYTGVGISTFGHGNGKAICFGIYV